jgi:ABC-2 type transport system ATP-binding protein
MELYSSFYDRPADSERLLDDLGLANKRDTSYGKLSGGQKQRLSIALALVGNPSSPSWTSSPPAWTPTPAATPGS